MWGRQEHEATGLIVFLVGKQREINGSTQLLFSLLVSLVPQHRLVLPTFSVALSSSVKASWKCPQRQTQRKFLGESKPNQVDTEEYSSQESLSTDDTKLRY